VRSGTVSAGPDSEPFVLKTRDLLVVFGTGRGDRCKPGPAETVPLRTWASCWTSPMNRPMASCDLPRARKPGDFCGRGGRFGAHAATSRFYPPYYGSSPSSRGSTRARASSIIRNPFAVEEVAYFIPAPNKNTMAFCADGVGHPEGDPKITPACTKVIQTTTSRGGRSRPHLQRRPAGHGTAHHPADGACSAGRGEVTTPTILSLRSAHVGRINSAVWNG